MIYYARNKFPKSLKNYFIRKNQISKMSIYLSIIHKKNAYNVYYKKIIGTI